MPVKVKLIPLTLRATQLVCMLVLEAPDKLTHSQEAALNTIIRVPEAWQPARFAVLTLRTCQLLRSAADRP